MTYNEHDLSIEINMSNNVQHFNREDVVIESSEYGHYAGRMQIVTQDMKIAVKVM